VVRGIVAVARLVQALPESKIETLAEPAELIGANETALDALVQMTESGTRQLVVVDSRQRPIGMLALSDVTRGISETAAAPSGLLNEHTE